MSSLLQGPPRHPLPWLCVPLGPAPFLSTRGTSPPRCKHVVDSDVGLGSWLGPNPRPAGTWPSDVLSGSYVHMRVDRARASRASWDDANVRDDVHMIGFAW